MVARVVAAFAALIVATGAPVAHADDKPNPLARVLEGEAGIDVIYTSSDYVGLGGYLGFQLAKPILGVFYVEPVAKLELDLTLSSRVTGLIRCNFTGTPGAVVSLGFGAGFGNHVHTDDQGNMSTPEPMSYRAVELMYKVGGKHRFGFGGMVAFDATAGDRTTLMVQFSLGRAGP